MTESPFRVLLASIKNLGKYPCPRCLMPMTSVPGMGKPQDMLDRITFARQDNEEKRSRVDKARQLILRKNISVDSAAVESHLAVGSLVPVNVSRN